MKKIVSLLLALTLVMSLAIPAFATTVADTQGGSTELFTIVPDASYILVVPATVEIPFGATEYKIGSPEVRDVVMFNDNDAVYMETDWTDLVCGNNVIDLEIAFDYYADGKKMNSNYNPLVQNGKDGYLQVAYQHFDGESFCYVEYVALITADAWANAAPGQYTATVTFSSEYNRYIPA